MLFGDTFFIWKIEAETDHSGHTGASRPRVYFLFLNKKRGVCLHNPVRLYKQLALKLQKHLYTTPSDYLVATDQEVQVEAMRMAALRNIPYTDTGIRLMHFSYLLIVLDLKTM